MPCSVEIALGTSAQRVVSRHAIRRENKAYLVLLESANCLILRLDVGGVGLDGRLDVE